MRLQSGGSTLPLRRIGHPSGEFGPCRPQTKLGNVERALGRRACQSARANRAFASIWRSTKSEARFPPRTPVVRRYRQSLLKEGREGRGAEASFGAAIKRPRLRSYSVIGSIAQLLVDAATSRASALAFVISAVPAVPLSEMRQPNVSFDVDACRPDPLPHVSVSSAMNFPNSAGVFDIGSTPKHKPRLYNGISRDGVDLFVELVDHLGRCVLRRTDAVPLARLVGLSPSIRTHLPYFVIGSAVRKAQARPLTRAVMRLERNGGEVR
jgi:hypothetical protein